MENYMNNRLSLEKKNLNTLLKLIKYPSITEKSMNLNSLRYYTFIVDRTLTKPQIKYVLQEIFSVTITDINTSILPTKTRRVGKFTGKCSRYKKAYIKIQEGQTMTDFLT